MEVHPHLRLAGGTIPPEARFLNHRQAFQASFGSAGEPARIFFAPGRVNLMGAHLDYNGGPVMPMAIDRGTFLALRQRSDGRLRLSSTREPRGIELDLSAALAAEPDGSWWDYPLGVLQALTRAPGVAPDRIRGSAGFDVYFGGDLPVGAGLSSSASIALVTATALDAVLELDLGVEAAIDAALWAEREFVGVQCGIMDPFAVGYARPGKVLVLDCSDRSWEHVDLDRGAFTVGIVDTGVRRELARGEFNLRVAQCAEAYAELHRHAPGASCLSEVPLAVLEAHRASLSPVVAKRARHVIEETQRTFAARDGLKRGDVALFGAAMFEAHDSLRDLYEVSIPELDTLVDVARACEGVLGARLTGAGFGGCVAAVLERGREQAFADAARAAFAAQYGEEPQVAFYAGSPGLGEVAPG